MFRRKQSERFTKAARQALVFAQVEAEKLQHQLVFPEHLLIGLIQAQDSIASRILIQCGLTETHLRSIVQELTVTYPKSKKTTDLASSTKSALEKAVDEALFEGLHYLSTYHLLLGIIRQTQGIVPEIFKQVHLTLDDVDRLTRHEVGRYKQRFGFKRHLRRKDAPYD